MIRFTLLMIFLVSCGYDSESKSRPHYDKLKAEISENQLKWQELAVKDYQYAFQKSCFCPTRDVLVTVRGGEITKVVDQEADSGVKDVPSIDDVFSDVLRWADARPENLDVNFDPDYFFIENATIDYDSDTADDGSVIRLSKFEKRDGP